MKDQGAWENGPWQGWAGNAQEGPGVSYGTRKKRSTKRTLWGQARGHVPAKRAPWQSRTEERDGLGLKPEDSDT